MELTKKSLYRFPWSLNDNPIGWLEVTDLCNLHCRGCYRLTLNKHKPFEVVQDEVRFLKRWRNCDSVSIAGGEPLIYPKIAETIAFIRDLGLKPFMLTNGIKASPERLRELRRAGLVGIGFHLDRRVPSPPGTFPRLHPSRLPGGNPTSRFLQVAHWVPHLFRGPDSGIRRPQDGRANPNIPPFALRNLLRVLERHLPWPQALARRSL